MLRILDVRRLIVLSVIPLFMRSLASMVAGIDEHKMMCTGSLDLLQIISFNHHLLCVIHCQFQRLSDCIEMLTG